MQGRAVRTDLLLACLLAYAAASLLHHVHNAEFLGEYPNLPATLSRMDVYMAWLVVTTIGAIGYLFFRGRHRRFGLAVLALYAALGLAGLAHYVVAPLSAHSLAMNLTICLEVATAALLLGVLACAW